MDDLEGQFGLLYYIPWLLLTYATKDLALSITAHILYEELEKIWVQHGGLRDQVGVGERARYVARSFPFLDRCHVVVANAVRSLIMPRIRSTMYRIWSICCVS
jgi:hypothetical protein